MNQIGISERRPSAVVWAVQRQVLRARANEAGTVGRRFRADDGVVAAELVPIHRFTLRPRSFRSRSTRVTPSLLRVGSHRPLLLFLLLFAHRLFFVFPGNLGVLIPFVSLVCCVGTAMTPKARLCWSGGGGCLSWAGSGRGE